MSYEPVPKLHRRCSKCESINRTSSKTAFICKACGKRNVIPKRRQLKPHRKPHIVPKTMDQFPYDDPPPERR